MESKIFSIVQGKKLNFSIGQEPKNESILKFRNQNSIPPPQKIKNIKKPNLFDKNNPYVGLHTMLLTLPP